jgi:hypothetical protein
LFISSVYRLCYLLQSSFVYYLFYVGIYLFVFISKVAALALYLCSDEASFVTGAAYAIDGGVACRM